MMIIHHRSNIRPFVAIFVLIAILVSCSLLQSTSAFTFSSTTIARTKRFGKVVRNNNNDDDDAEQRQQKIPEPGAEAAPSASDVQELFKMLKAMEANFAKEREKTNAELKEEREKTNAKMETMEATLTDVKTELTDAKTELTDVKTELTDAKTKLTDVKTELTHVKTEQGQLKGRLNNIVLAFKPAIQYAVFETFIYRFVELECLKLGVHESHNSYIQYQLAIFCRDVIKKLNGGKQKLKLKISNSKDETKLLVLRALQGTVEYVKYEDRDLIQRNMFAAARNAICHDGALLKYLFPDPERVNEETNTFTTTEGKIKKFKDDISGKFTAMGRDRNPYQNPTEAVEALFNAMRTKQLKTSEGAKSYIIDYIKERIGDLPPHQH